MPLRIIYVLLTVRLCFQEQVLINRQLYLPAILTTTLVGNNVLSCGDHLSWLREDSCDDSKDSVYRVLFEIGSILGQLPRKSVYGLCLACEIQYELGECLVFDPD